MYFCSLVVLTAFYINLLQQQLKITLKYYLTVFFLNA